MTLHKLLKSQGIKNYRDLRDRCDLSREYAWMLWKGRANVSVQVARKIKAATGLALDDILGAGTLRPNDTKRKKKRH